MIKNIKFNTAIVSMIPVQYTPYSVQKSNALSGNTYSIFLSDKTISKRHVTADEASPNVCSFSRTFDSDCYLRSTLSTKH